MGRDILSAYVATGARLLSWAVVSALVYRNMGATAFAALSLARALVGVLNYVSFGMGPALIHRLALEQSRAVPALPVQPDLRENDKTLSYASPHTGRDLKPAATPQQRLYASALTTLVITTLLGGFALTIFASALGEALHVGKGLRNEIAAVIWLMGAGVLLRILSDAPGALLQSSGRIAVDNWLLAAAELSWMGLSWATITEDHNHLPRVAGWFAASSFGLLLMRLLVAGFMTGVHGRNVQIDWAAGWGMLGYGVLITLAQLADFLYAPANYLIINQLLDPVAVAAYAPAVQIDGAMLVVVAGLASVLLPKAALAHGAGQWATLATYYVRATVASFLVLAAMAAGVYLASPAIFRLWLDDDMPQTRAILPLLLVSTVVGGSGMAGRSILIGIGKVKPFTIAAIIAGVANVILGFVFVRFFGLGLRGIVYATLIVVIARAGIWLPWYVMRSLRDGRGGSPSTPSPDAN